MRHVPVRIEHTYARSADKGDNAEADLSMQLRTLLLCTWVFSACQAPAGSTNESVVQLPAVTPESTPQRKETPQPDPSPDPTNPIPITNPDPTNPDPLLPFVNTGWVGGACASNVDCPVDGAFCRTEGFPGGMCSLDCSPTARTCLDTEEPNTTTTFCAAAGAASVPACVARCSFVDTDVGRGYPENGCRSGYVCATRPRYDDTSAINDVCIPSFSDTPAISACRMDYARAGNDYRAWKAPQATSRGKACTVLDAMALTPEVEGVSFRNGSNAATTLYARCEMATALAKLSRIAKELGIKEIKHYGTYNCREIGSTNTLSQHAYARAIDIAAFVMEDGERISVLNDWERGDATPETAQGKLLYTLVHRLHDERVFNVILTPEYNSAHHDHFHLDLKPGSDFIGRSAGDSYLGTFDGIE